MQAELRTDPAINRTKVLMALGMNGEQRGTRSGGSQVPGRNWKKFRLRKSQISRKSMCPANEMTQETFKRSGKFGAINGAFY